MGAMAPQITSLAIVYPTVYSGTDQRKYQSSASLAFCAGNSPGIGEFPAQLASNAENVSIWWRHHDNAANIELPDIVPGYALLYKNGTLIRVYYIY